MMVPRADDGIICSTGDGGKFPDLEQFHSHELALLAINSFRDQMTNSKLADRH